MGEKADGNRVGPFAHTKQGKYKKYACKIGKEVLKVSISLHFYDKEARNYYDNVVEVLEGFQLEHIDNDDLVMHSNLRAQRIELEKSIKKDGFVVVNENSRGGKTHQIHPAHRAYISCVGEIGKIVNRLKKSFPDMEDYFDKEFEEF